MDMDLAGRAIAAKELRSSDVPGPLESWGIYTHAIPNSSCLLSDGDRYTDGRTINLGRE